MFEARNIQLPRKINLVLNKSLISFKDLSISDKGQMIIKGYIKGEKTELTSDGSITIKTIFVDSVELSDKKIVRIIDA